MSDLDALAFVARQSTLIRARLEILAGLPMPRSLEVTDQNFVEPAAKLSDEYRFAIGG